MISLNKAKWIWAKGKDGSLAKADEYAEFYECVEYYGRCATLSISADSNYAVYVNGTLAAFGQYPDFPYDKVYDRIDLSRFMRYGKNVIAIRAWYYGIESSQTYYPGEAGVIFAFEADGVLLFASSEKTQSRLSASYRQHGGKIITNQLGLSFGYDANKADGWLFGEPSPTYPFSDSRESGVTLPLRERSCLRCELGDTLIGQELPKERIKPLSEKGRIFDLGSEGVGFICLDFVSSSDAPITVAFGEHIADGHVRMDLGGRRFAFDYIPAEGRNYFMNPMRRFGCRYIELLTEGEISDVRISLSQVVYPVVHREMPKGLDSIQRQIYDACVYTLICCMHEHYEDCPWREQALYTMDSRNQMLAGYYAFGEYTFPRANLELIAKDDRADGLLSICYPMKDGLAIPSFSMHFITECEEYLRYSKDADFIRQIYPKIKSVLDTFVCKIEGNGLIRPVAGEGMWNFYEWQSELDGTEQLSAGNTPEGLEPDLILNTLLSIAISKFENIQRTLGFEPEYEDVRKRLNEAIQRHFFDEAAGVYRNRRSRPAACKLGNALAILAGVPGGELSAKIAEKLTEENLTDASLSMQGFVYDAMIQVDREKYRDYILSRIEKTYEPMVEWGNGTVWETELGDADFHNAGSLCHGWSAIPIYYYNVLLGEYNEGTQI